jgi:uncharacterized protein (DUF2236 family)
MIPIISPICLAVKSQRFMLIAPALFDEVVENIAELKITKRIQWVMHRLTRIVEIHRILLYSTVRKAFEVFPIKVQIFQQVNQT